VERLQKDKEEAQREAETAARLERERLKQKRKEINQRLIDEQNPGSRIRAASPTTSEIDPGADENTSEPLSITTLIFRRTSTLMGRIAPVHRWGYKGGRN
jgi:hypothetical protein